MTESIYIGVIIFVTFTIFTYESKRIVNGFNNYLELFTFKIIEFVWIPVGYILIKVFDIDIKLLNRLNDYKEHVLLIIIVFLAIELIVKYKNSLNKYLCKMAQYINICIAVCGLVELIITNAFINRWIIILIALINIAIILEIREESIGEKDNNRKSKMNEKECSSYEELFPTRQQQADSIITYINSCEKYDRFTLLLNGDWGTGKTSLIKGVEQKCRADYSMIFIQPMLFDKKELLIEYFFKQLKSILSQGNIYTGKGSSIEKYLIMLLKWIDTTKNIGIMDSLLNNPNESFRKIKKELQRDINKYSEIKKIIVIVDDFDRIGNDTVKEILMFIREIIDFDGISTILLMNYSRIIGEEISKEYLDKYIDKRIDLNDVELNEVVNTFITWCIEEEIKDNEMKKILIGFSKNFNEIMADIITKIKKPLDNERNSMDIWGNNRDSNEENLKKEKEFTENYAQLIEKVIKETKNIRLIKKIIRELVYSYKKLQIPYKDSIILCDDDIILIFKFLLIKNVFIDEYNRIQNCTSFYEYFYNVLFECNEEQKCISILLGELEYSTSKLNTVNKYKMIDAIITCNFKNIGYETKKESEKVLDEIDRVIELGDDNKTIINSPKSEQEYIERFEIVYSYIYNNFYENGDYLKTKERLNKLNHFLINYTSNNPNKQLEIVLEIYKKCIRIRERYELNYILIKQISNLLKKIDIYNINQIEIINRYISSFRERNLSFLGDIIKVILRVNNINLQADDNIFFKVEDFNKEFIRKFNFNIDKSLSEINKFDCLLYRIKSEIIKSTIFDGLNINYLYTSITKHQTIEKILVRIEKNINENKNPKKLYKDNMRTYIESCTDYKDFEAVSMQIINDILSDKQQFNYDTLNQCYGIINRAKGFIKEKNVGIIVELMKSVCEEAQKNRFPNDYNYIQVQNLIVATKELNSIINLNK